MPRHYRHHLAVTCFYGVLGFLALHKILFKMNTHITGQGVTDHYHFAWNYWWIEHALKTGDPLYYTDYIFYPSVSNLSFHTLTLFWFPLWRLLLPIVGEFSAFHIIMWVAFTITGISGYALLRSEQVNRSAALLGGTLLQVTPLMFVGAWWNTINLMGVFWYPIHLLLWKKTTESQSTPGGIFWAITQGVALWLAAITDLQYLLFLSLLLIPYGVTTVALHTYKIKLLALATLTAITPISIAGVTGQLNNILAFDSSRVVPASPGLVWGVPFPQGYLSVMDYQNHTSLGGIITGAFLLTVAISLIRPAPPERWLWIGLGAIPLILTLGYEITINGTTITMPYGYLHEPSGGIFRAPSRLGAVFVVAALVFIGKTWTNTITARPTKQLPVTVALLLLILFHHHVLRSVDIQPAPRQYEIYEVIAADPHEYVVAEVPIAAGDALVTVGSPYDLAPQYYGSVHHKPMITGHISRAYLDHYWYMKTDHPALSWLGQRTNFDPQRTYASLAEIIFNYPIGYIIVRQDSIGLENPLTYETLGRLNEMQDLICPPHVEYPLVIYRTQWHPDGCTVGRTPPLLEDTYTIDLGSKDDAAYLGQGWYWAEFPGGISWRWSGLKDYADLYIDIPPGQYTITITVQALLDEQYLEIVLNNQVIHVGTIAGGQLETITTEGNITEDGTSRLRFRYPTTAENQINGRTLVLAFNEVEISIKMN